MNSYEFSLPWPPSVNQWKTPFRNRMILTKRGRDYRASVLSRCDELRISNENLSGRLKVSMTLNPPTKRKHDIDNFCKSPFDGLTKAGFWLDDEQVDVLNVRRGEVIDGGSVDFVVSVING